MKAIYTHFGELNHRKSPNPISRRGSGGTPSPPSQRVHLGTVYPRDARVASAEEHMVDDKHCGRDPAHLNFVSFIAGTRPAKTYQFPIRIILVSSFET